MTMKAPHFPTLERLVDYWENATDYDLFFPKDCCTTIGIPTRSFVNECGKELAQLIRYVQDNESHTHG